MATRDSEFLLENGRKFDGDQIQIRPGEFFNGRKHYNTNIKQYLLVNTIQNSGISQIGHIFFQVKEKNREMPGKLRMRLVR